MESIVYADRFDEPPVLSIRFVHAAPQMTVRHVEPSREDILLNLGFKRKAGEPLPACGLLPRHELP